MNHTTLALVVILAAAIGFYTLIAPQSAAAQSFNTDNSATQGSTQTGTPTAGSGGSSDSCIAFCFTPGGSASVSQTVCQQAAQSGAFGSSSNDILKKSCGIE